MLAFVMMLKMLMQGGEHALKFAVLKQPPGSLHINANAHIQNLH